MRAFKINAGTTAISRDIIADYRVIVGKGEVNAFLIRKYGAIFDGDVGAIRQENAGSDESR